MKLRAHIALGIVIGAALDRDDIRRVSSVFYTPERDALVVRLEPADAAFEDVDVVLRSSEIPEGKKSELEEWADALIEHQMSEDDVDDDDDDDGADATKE